MRDVKECMACGIHKGAKFFPFQSGVLTKVERIVRNKTLENTQNVCIVCKGNGKDAKIKQASLIKW